MLIIATQELASPYCTPPPESESIVRHDGALELADGAAVGWLLTPPITPMMAMRYVGFDLLPTEQNMMVSALTGGSTTSLANAEAVRGILATWIGELQFHIQLTRDPNGRSPRLQALRVGYEVAGDFLGYVMEWVLRPWCGAPVGFVRYVVTRNGSTLPLPGQLNPAQMSALQILSPGLALRSATLMTNPDRIELTQSVDPGMVQLQFRYSPDVEHVTGIFQLDEVPVVLMRLLPGENYCRINASDWVRMAGDRAQIWQACRQYDQPVELEVLAHSLDDARAIAQSLLSRIEQSGILPIPAFGLTVVMRVRSPIQVGDVLQGEGNLFSLRLQLAFLGLIEGEQQSEVPLLVEYIQDFLPT